MLSGRRLTDSRIAARGGYRDAGAMGDAWGSLLEQCKLILAGDYEAALDESRGKAVRFASPLIGGAFLSTEDDELR